MHTRIEKIKDINGERIDKFIKHIENITPDKYIIEQVGIINCISDPILSDVCSEILLDKDGNINTSLHLRLINKGFSYLKIDHSHFIHIPDRNLWIRFMRPGDRDSFGEGITRSFKRLVDKDGNVNLNAYLDS